MTDEEPKILPSLREEGYRWLLWQKYLENQPKWTPQPGKTLERKEE